MMNKIRTYRSILGTSCFLFLAFFLPPLIRVSMTYILMFLMMMYIVRDVLFRHSSFIFGRMRPFYGFIPFVIYLVLTGFYRIICGETTDRVAYVYNIKHIAIVIIYLAIFFEFLKRLCGLKKSRLTVENVYQAAILAAMIQVVLVVVSYFNRNVQHIFNGFVLRNGLNEITTANVSKFIFRSYGLTGYFLDNFSFIVSGLSVFTLSKGMDENKFSYCIFSFMMTATSVLAARTGIVLSFIGYTVVIIFNLRKLKICDLYKWFFVFCISVALVLIVYSNLAPARKELIVEGLSSIHSLSTHEKNGVFSEIFGNDLVFPSNVLIGAGAKPESIGFGDCHGHAIDNGYVQLVWRFGIIGTILLFFGYICFYMSIFKKSKNNTTRCLCVAFPIIIAFYYCKLYPISIHGANLVYFILPIAQMLADKKKMRGEDLYGKTSISEYCYNMLQ